MSDDEILKDVIKHLRDGIDTVVPTKSDSDIIFAYNFQVKH